MRDRCQGPCWSPHWWPSNVPTCGHGLVSPPGGGWVGCEVWGLLGRAVDDRTAVLGAGQGGAQRPSGARVAPCAPPRVVVRPLGGRPGRTPGFLGGGGAGGGAPRTC